jgi:hypothetical protein
MNRYLYCLIIVAAAASSIVYAQDARAADHKGTPEQQRACRADALKLCHGIHDDDAVYQCLKANATKLHASCREVIGG